MLCQGLEELEEGGPPGLRAGWPAPSPPPSQGSLFQCDLGLARPSGPAGRLSRPWPGTATSVRDLGQVKEKSIPWGCLRATLSSHSIISPPHHAEVRIRNPISQMRPLRIRRSYASHTLGSLRAYHLFTIQGQQNVSPQVLGPKAQPEQDTGDHGKQLPGPPCTRSCLHSQSP